MSEHLGTVDIFSYYMLTPICLWIPYEVEGARRSMHEFTNGGANRGHVFFVLAAMSLGVVDCLHWFSGKIHIPITITALSVFGAVRFAFDKWIWRWQPISRFLGTPNLSGSWAVTGKKLNQAGDVESCWRGKIEIVQRWSSISIGMLTDNSQSKSNLASIEIDPTHGIRLLFTYSNNPTPSEVMLTPHSGTCSLLFEKTLTKASGQYYSDFHRKSFGIIDLTKE